MPPIQNKHSKPKSGKKRTSAKKDEILDVAAGVFLKFGYKGTSVNEMARCSGISKETIYRHFESKQKLFSEVLDKELQHYQGESDYVIDPDEHTDTKKALKQYGKMLLKILLEKRTLSLRGLIFLESGIHPELGKLYYDLGPRRGYMVLKQYFDMKLKHGMKSQFDADKLSRYFAALVLYNVMLEYQCGVKRSISEKELDKHVDEIVDDFMNLYIK